MSMVAFHKESSIHQDPIDERIRQMEVKYNLLQYKVDGWCVWPPLRFSVHRELSNPPLATKDELRRAEKMALAARGLTSLISPREARCFVKTYSSARA